MKADRTVEYGLGERSTAAFSFLGKVLGCFPPHPHCWPGILVVTRLHRVGGSVGTRAHTGRARPIVSLKHFRMGQGSSSYSLPALPWNVRLATGKLGTLGSHLSAMNWGSKPMGREDFSGMDQHPTFHFTLGSTNYAVALPAVALRWH